MTLALLIITLNNNLIYSIESQSKFNANKFTFLDIQIHYKIFLNPNTVFSKNYMFIVKRLAWRYFTKKIKIKKLNNIKYFIENTSPLLYILCGDWGYLP